MREVATMLIEIQDYYTLETMKSSGHISAEPIRGQKIEKHAATDLVFRNNENRPSLTSGAEHVAEERQEASSKNTIYRKT